jgi:NTE family protein
MDIGLVLKQIPLFSNLSAEQRHLIAARAQIIEYKKGQTIYKEGDPPNAFFCIVSGRAVILTRDAQAKETVLEYLHRGKYFGMISLLTGEPHSVTATALNDCLVLKIDKNDFDYILRKVPLLAIDLSLTLSRRLKRKDIHRKTIFESTIISIFSAAGQMGKTIYALNLVLSLKKETAKSIILLDIGLKGKPPSIPMKLDITYQPQELGLSDASFEVTRINEYILKDKLGIDLLCLSYQAEDESSMNRLLGILSVLVNDYHYIILDLPTGLDKAVFSILNQSDLIHIIAGPDIIQLKRTARLIYRLKKEFEFKEEKIKVILNDYKLSLLSPQQRAGILRHEIFATLPRIEYGQPHRLILDMPDCEYAKVIRRISRQLGECTVGLALGVGAAFGLCHIGVLKVIEKEKIPIDMISGSSIGAVIAALWAAGYSASVIEEIAAEFKDSQLIMQLLDLTFPRLGFIKGYRIYKLLKKYLGNKTFYDVKLPLKVLASNIKSKESIAIDKGPLVEAVMASCAMPGVFRPVRFKEELLLDGGVLNPLPVEALLASGIKKIIAVNVTPSREDLLRACEDMKTKTPEVKEKIKRRFGLFGFKWYIKDLFKTNIFDFIFGSIEIMQSEIAKKEATLADIVLHPDTSGLKWLEFHKAEDFIKRGEEETHKNLDRIWQLIRE